MPCENRSITRRASAGALIGPPEYCGVPPLELTVAPLELPLVHTFTIARSSESIARTALVRLRWHGIDALGESSPSIRYGESVESVIAGLGAHPLGDDPYAIDALLLGLPPAQRCGLDVAL